MVEDKPEGYHPKGRISTYLGKVTGRTSRRTKRELAIANLQDVLDDISEIGRDEEAKERVLREKYVTHQISLKQYYNLLKHEAKAVLRRLGHLEHMIKQYSTVIAVSVIAVGLGVYSFFNPTMTGHAIINRKFDANFLMISLILGASALLLLAKLSARILKR